MHDFFDNDEVCEYEDNLQITRRNFNGFPEYIRDFDMYEEKLKKFYHGQRVIKLHGIVEGTIIRAYEKFSPEIARENNNVISGCFPELYDVEWDDGTKTIGHYKQHLKAIL